MKLGFSVSKSVSVIIFIIIYCWFSDVRFFATPLQKFDSTSIVSREKASTWRTINIQGDLAPDGIAMGRTYIILLGGETVYGMSFGPSPKYYIPALQNTDTVTGMIIAIMLYVAFL